MTEEMQDIDAMIGYLLASGYVEVSGCRCPECGSEKIISSGVRTLWSNPVDSEALGTGLELRCTACLHSEFKVTPDRDDDVGLVMPNWKGKGPGTSE